MRSETEVEIVNELGLHLRAASAIAKLADRFQSEITFRRDSASANGRSIIGLVSLEAPKGTVVRIVAEGADATEAVQALTDLIEGRFGEDR